MRANRTTQNYAEKRNRRPPPQAGCRWPRTHSDNPRTLRAILGAHTMRSPHPSTSGVAHWLTVMALAILTVHRAAVMAFLGTAALFLACASSAWAAPGDLDPTFGGAGKVTTPFSTRPGDGATVYAVAVQPNGKIVAAGSAFRSPQIGA